MKPKARETTSCGIAVLDDWKNIPKYAHIYNISYQMVMIHGD